MLCSSATVRGPSGDRFAFLRVLEVVPNLLNQVLRARVDCNLVTDREQAFESST